MKKGNFSNNGQDTFDALKQYIGIRLQQGVPLLDRDWNELEDIRRYFERRLRQYYIGKGVPDLNGFRIYAHNPPVPNDFMIAAGRCMVDGFDVWNPQAILYSEQPGSPKLPSIETNRRFTVCLIPGIERVDQTDDPDLLNRQDIDVETCLRDRLTWRVIALPHPIMPPPNSFLLATINRTGESELVTPDSIKDLRRTQLNLANTVDNLKELQALLDILDGKIGSMQIDLEEIKDKLGRLFWDVDLESSHTSTLFGTSVQIKARVVDGHKKPVSGAHLSFSTDWGSISPAAAVTNAKGEATTKLIGIQADIPPPKAEVALLGDIAKKVQMAVIGNPGAIEYAKIRFEPLEIALISKHSTPNTLFDLSRNLPTKPIIELPKPRTATVTVHAKEAKAAIVRGVGNIQVLFGMWVRDWAKTKIWDIVSKVGVTARVSDFMRQGVVEGAFQIDEVFEILPEKLQGIHDDVQDKIKSNILEDPKASDLDLTNSGMLGQSIAQEATSAVGFKTNQAILAQIDQFEKEKITIDKAKARTRIEQGSSNITAGITQNQKQKFSSFAGSKH